jgi:predicted RNA-binding protein with PIN domain
MSRAEQRPNWLIDGMNVIGSRPNGWWRDRPGAVKDLATRLGPFALATPGEVRVVFDGPLVDVSSSEDEVDVEFASGGRNAADGRIVSFLRGADRPQDWTVVTSDRALADACAELGTAVMGAGEFRELLEAV